MFTRWVKREFDASCYVVVSSRRCGDPTAVCRLNGALAGEDQAGGAAFPAGCELVIGRRGVRREVSYFNGLLDGALVFERALDFTEIGNVMRW